MYKIKFQGNKDFSFFKTELFQGYNWRNFRYGDIVYTDNGDYKFIEYKDDNVKLIELDKSELISSFGN